MGSALPAATEAAKLFKELRKQKRPRAAEDLAAFLTVPFEQSVFRFFDDPYHRLNCLYRQAYRLIVTAAYIVACSPYYCGVRSVEAIRGFLYSSPDAIRAALYALGDRGEMPVGGLTSLVWLEDEYDFATVIRAALGLYED